MTDNKKLIEGIRQTGDPAHPLVLRGWAELSVKDIAVLRAYFEKAHTPTDDERQQLDDIMAEAYGYWPPARALILERFRRSEEPEPSAQIECPHWSPGRITLRKGCTACEASAEPQGEPSDAHDNKCEAEYVVGAAAYTDCDCRERARVEAAVKTFWASRGAVTTRMRAALRAAGGVR